MFKRSLKWEGKFPFFLEGYLSRMILNELNKAPYHIRPYLKVGQVSWPFPD
jgi:hypothetical protein